MLIGQAIRVVQRDLPLAERKLRYVKFVWFLLFFDVLGSGPTVLLPIPHKVGQLITQGALWLAFLLALSINPKVKVRPNLFLAIYTLIAIAALMSSVRLVSIGTAYRALRILGFVLTLWLTTPWWGRWDIVVLRSQVKFLLIILGSVLISILLSPGGSFAGGRLGDALWPIPATQVAHYSAELAGLCVMLWVCRLWNKWPALLVGVPSFVVLVLTHTRTALVASIAGCIVGAISLFTVSRRVRRAFAAGIATVALVVVPMSPLIVQWMTRGESASQVASLTGRTNFWGYVFQAAAHRPLTNQILGDGISNGSVNDPVQPNVDGLPIDSSWVADYQDEGLAGDVLVGLMFAVLLLTAAIRPRGPARAVALFLTIYCLIASFTEDGAGIASQYTLDLAVAASLLMLPMGSGNRLRHRALGASAGAS